MIDKKLIHFNKRETFDTELENGNIPDTSIVFIKDTQEIWTHGQIYNASAITIQGPNSISNAVGFTTTLTDEQKNILFNDSNKLVWVRFGSGYTWSYYPFYAVEYDARQGNISYMPLSEECKFYLYISSNTKSIKFLQTHSSTWIGDQQSYDFKENKDSSTLYIINSPKLKFYLGDTLLMDPDTKVDKVEGKDLSTNDFTDAYKTKLDSIAAGAEVNVQSDWNVTDTDSDAFIKNKPTSMPASDVPAWAKAATKPTYTKAEVGLGNVDNTSDANKPISTATQTALNNKVDKVVGKGLSSNDYTDAEKDKLAKLQGSVVALTQAQYNALTTKDSETLYVVD